MNIILIFLFIIILCCLFGNNIENFEIKRKRRKGPSHVQMGFLNNTPKPIKKLMTALNKIGGQLDADKQYDTVAKGYLDKDKIK